MNIIRSLLGPKSKYDQTLPFTYYARTFLEDEKDEFVEHYFADTICGLVDYLDNNSISPDAVRLYGAYSKGSDISIEIESCLNRNGKWLHRPEICESMEVCYKKTKNNCYRGHMKEGRCSFDDRDRTGGGPY